MFDLDHLKVRMHERNLVIYSEENGIEMPRAVFSLFPGNRFLLCVANHKGKWQPTPFIGTAAEVWKALTGKLAFALARWE
ncbi:hypothetical protein ACFPPD_09925 [Cohnella suwonensis]|uniref:Uncharacterized protein n=1 Tax=Cohnella suwonensis TaxID=696072 RepID=A0ABW0LWE5_9BACL